jgi:hypothetical protein
VCVFCPSGPLQGKPPPCLYSPVGPDSFADYYAAFGAVTVVENIHLPFQHPSVSASGQHPSVSASGASKVVLVDILQFFQRGKTSDELAELFLSCITPLVAAAHATFHAVVLKLDGPLKTLVKSGRDRFDIPLTLPALKEKVAYLHHVSIALIPLLSRQFHAEILAGLDLQVRMCPTDAELAIALQYWQDPSHTLVCGHDGDFASLATPFITYKPHLLQIVCFRPEDFYSNIWDHVTQRR